MTPFRTILVHLLVAAVLPLNAQNVDSATVAEEDMMPSLEAPQQTNSAELEIGQLIIDNTFSKAGSDFQQIFNTRWNWPSQHAEQFIITISERPSFLNSTLIEITVNELKVFESFLQPKYDVLEETAARAIDITLQYILNYEDIVRELSGEDLSGSGIY